MNNKILVVLISDQHIPNLLSVHHYEPEYLIMMVSKDMEKKKNNNNFLKALSIGGKDYKGKFTEISIENVADYEGVKNKLNLCFQKFFSNYEWICNITGGTKIMSLATFEFFREKDKKIVYIEISKCNEIINVITGEKENCGYRPTINEFLAGYGYKNIKNDKELKEEKRRAEEWEEIANLMALHCSGRGYLKFNDENGNSNNNISNKGKESSKNKRRSNARKKGICLEKGELVIENSNLRNLIRERLNLKEESDGSLVGDIDKYSARYLTGDWLCLFFYNLLNKHKDALNLWDLNLGINPAPNNNVQANNDYDVAFIKDYSLCMIECKTGAQAHDKGLDIFYKIDSVIKNTKALKVKTFLGITSDVIYENSENKIKESISDRGKALNCTIIDREKIIKLAQDTGNIEKLKECFEWK